MASIYKRGQIWWVKFHNHGRLIRKSLRTTNRQPPSSPPAEAVGRPAAQSCSRKILE